jgi:Periplasmic lysozyme inhibitor of I-type lysozyme
MKFPTTSEVVVVAEGDREPASVGSYSVRIYSGVNPAFPLDEYLAGVVRPRDGAIEQVKFQDVDGDGRTEIVVIMRSAGSGSYISADAFTYANKSITLLASVSGVAKNTDPLPVLTAVIKKGAQ